ncbi:MAG: hypothetical protein ACYSW7_12575 [Planctomycetota bacterium]
MNGKDLKGQAINVEEGRRKTPRWTGGGRQQSGFGRGGRGGGGRGGGGRGGRDSRGGFKGGERGGRRY